MNDKDNTSVAPGHLVTRQTDARLPAARTAEQDFQKALEKRPGSLSRLFPSATDKAVAEHRATEMRQVGDARRRGLSMALEAKLQAIEEELNETLSKGKAELRVDAELFIQGQFDRLVNGLNQRMETFQADLDRRFEHLDSIKYAPIRSKEEQRIALDYERYADWVESKIDEFRAAMADRVRR